MASDLVNGIRRRNRIDLCTPAENAIRAAIQAVESMGADERLTDIIIDLDRAREKLADYVDATSEEAPRG